MFIKVHQIKWVLFIFFTLGRIKGELIPEVTLISEKINSYETRYRNITCVVSGNSTDSAITWNEPLPLEDKILTNYVSEYIPARTSSYNCNIDGTETCNKDWGGKNGWLRQRSFYSKLGPVTDHRWEEFQIYYTNKSTKMKTIAAISEVNFKIHISIRIEEEAYIYLCDDEDKFLTNCYVIMLGGPGSTENNNIKVCSNGTKHSNVFSKDDCVLLRGEIRRSLNDRVLSEQEWRHFTIQKESDNILLWQMGSKTPTLNSTNEQTKLFKARHLSIKSGETPGFWKIHEYTYVFTSTETASVFGPIMDVRQNNFCMAMFVAMCDHCNLKLEVFYLDTVQKEIIKTIIIKPIQVANDSFDTRKLSSLLKGMEWQEEKLQISIPDFPRTIQLRVHSICPSGNCANPFWAIDNFQICSENEIRVLSIVQDPDKATCQLIKYTDCHLNQTAPQTHNSRERNCIGGTFSKSCTECSLVLGPQKPYCDNSIICDLQSNRRNICTCATGYTGPLCETSLEKVEKLRVTNVYPTSITISWEPPQGIVHEEIKNYNIRYKQNKYMACGNEHKMTEALIKDIVVQTQTVTINNLLPYSEYVIEISAVSDINGIPTTILANTLQTNDLEILEIPTIKSVKAASTEVKITLQQVNCELIKGPITYEITTVCSNSWCNQGGENIIHIENNPIILKDLHAYSNYTVKIKVGRRNGNLFNGYRISATFQTDISAPSIIGNLTAYSKNETSISLRFLPPSPPNGNIEHYLLNYCGVTNNVVSNNCVHNKFEPKQCKLWKNFHCIILENLDSNRKYEIRVYAKNEGSGYNYPATIYAKTTQEKPGVLENLTYKWDNYSNLTLTWSRPNITNGPLTQFMVTIINSEHSTCYNKSFPINEENYKATYCYVISFDACYSSYLTIQAFAFNVYQGDPVIKTLFSPPKTPSFQTILSVESITNSTITINLPLPQELTNNSVMYVIVSNPNNSLNISKDFDKILDKMDVRDNASWVAAEYDFKQVQAVPQTLIIGNGTNQISTRLDKEFNNRILNSTTTYKISVVIITEFGGFVRCNVSTIQATTTDSNHSEGLTQSSYNGLWALLVLFILLGILGIIIYRKRKELEMYWISIRNSNNSDAIPLAKTTRSKSGKIAQFTLRFKHKTPVDENIDVVQHRISNVNKGFSKPVKVMEFEIYVKGSISNGELLRQHQLLPRGQTKPWDYGLLSENKSKNRYRNLVAYDYNRVILNKISNDQYSDYINANYIEGYSTKKTYIATQGPKATTVNDFWRMIWQENVKNIIVLTNVMEGGKKKSEQYWPNVNESLKFGNVKVEYVSSRVYEDYERRRFLVSYKKSERRVEQLHFTSWPDHGVPLYPHSLVPFMRKILTIPQGNSPIVVHCSAGVGRTGTIILCDLCLRMAAREGVVDVLKHQSNLREQRINLVDNIEQYKLAHLVLLECLIAPQTNISCDDETEGAITRLLESERVVQQMVYLNGTAWQDEAMRPSSDIAPNPEWSKKNRFQDIIPWGYGQIKLSWYPTSDENSDYINAVEVDGFRSPQRFIVTQQPLPQTKSDFWRMINEKKVTTIVSLNEINSEDETSCLFWPTESDSEIQPVPFLTLHFENISDADHYSIITIHMRNNEDKEGTKRTIKLILLKCWPANKTLPNEGESLLKLWQETEKVSDKSNTIVVTCYDGAKACGLFTALSIVVEKIKFEQECDVCSAVRTVRHNRKQFVTDIEQFSFLYRAARKYLSCFDLYSNINPA